VLPSRPHLPKAPGREDKTDLSVGSVLRSSSALRSASTDQHDGTPCGSPMAKSHQPVAAADLLYARMSRVEERVAAEQRLRGETEQRITQQLQQLVGVSISEQLDTLRQQLMDERMQRQVDINAIRASLETARLSRPSQMEESIKAEVERSVESVKMSLEQTCSVARNTNAEAKHAEAMQKLEELEARLMSLEASEKEMACTSPSCSPKSPGRQGLKLERQVNTLQRGMDALQERLDDLTAKMQESTPDSIPYDFDKVSSFVREKLDGLRIEWTKVVDEERERASLRSQALGRALTEEFEKSVVTQVIAEACTEARAFVGVELDARLQNINLSTCGKGTEYIQTAIHKLSQDLEALRNLGFQQSCTGQDIFDRLKRVEDAQTDLAQLSGDTKQCSAADAKSDLKAHSEQLEQVQRRLGCLEDSMQTKLQALVNKLDSKCLEGLVPVLENLGVALKERPRHDSKAPFCSPSSSSGHSDRASRFSEHRTEASNSQSLDESTKMEFLVQENLRLREVDLKHREDQIRARERAAARETRSASPVKAPSAPPPQGRPAPRGSLQAGPVRPMQVSSPAMRNRAVASPHHPPVVMHQTQANSSGRMIPLQPRARALSPPGLAASPAHGLASTPGLPSHR